LTPESPGGGILGRLTNFFIQDVFMLRSLLAYTLIAALSLGSSLADTPAPHPAASATPIPTAPPVDAAAYVLIDFKTNKVLASKDETARRDPASLTKLMTVYLVFEQLASGKLKLEDQVVVSEHAWRAGGAGTDGSSSFLELGKPVSVQDLLLGVVVQSGNDASIVLAERIGGTEQTFAQLMNSNAQRLGMVGTHFENSTGLPAPQHYTTAHDMAVLARALIQDYPQYYKWFSVREFEHNHIKQQNRNGLLDKDPTVDGLKTGHTDAAGFCLVTSSLRDGMRLISVVLGSGSMRARENASASLLGYGFNFYETKLAVKGGTALASTKVWKAAQSPADLGIKDDLYLTLPRGGADIKTSTDVPLRVIAPLAQDAAVGTLHVAAGGQNIDMPLHPLKPVELGGWWRRLIDTIRLWFA
jgi:serine-type D-Ala-D-Ala carboxypeptidase (penicillin-binding protein 5/6)